jgi:hypothetical protein
MRAFLLIVAVLFTLVGCATNVVLQAAGGSRADSIVDLSYEYGGFGVTKYYANQAVSTARASCAAWGYPSAQPFGGQTTKCEFTDLLGSCIRYQVTVAYQCTGAGTPGGRR